LERCQLSLQFVTRRYNFALVRHYGAEFASMRPAGEISIRYFLGGSFRNSFDDDLTLKRMPEKGETESRLLFDCFAFLGVVVGIENKSVVGKLLEEYNAGLRKSVDAHS